MRIRIIVLMLAASGSAWAQENLPVGDTPAELVIRSEQACALRINGREEGQLASNMMRTISIRPGDLLVECDAGHGQRAEKIVKAVAGESAVALLAFGAYERYVRVADGVQDRQERIVWAASDSGSKISWDGAKAFCSTKGDGWRLPTGAELGGLRDDSGNNKIRWNDPTDEFCDLEAALTTPLIRWTAPCFHYDVKGGAWCLGNGVKKIGRSGICVNALAPADKARALCVRDDGVRGYVGIEIEHVSEFESRRLRLPQIGGARIIAFQPDGPAHKAGLLMDDVVMGFDDTQVGNAEQLKLLIQKSEPGRTATFSIFREGETLSVPVVLGAGP